MATNSTVLDNLQVGGGFTHEQVQALINAFEVYEDRLTTAEATLATLDGYFGDLSTADADDTLTADAQGVFQVTAV